MAVIQLNPVRYTTDGRLEAIEELTLRLRHRPRTPDSRLGAAGGDGAGPEPAPLLSPSQAHRFFDQARSGVLNPELVVRIPPGRLFHTVAYLLITTFWTGRFLKMQVDNPGEGWPGSLPADLVRLDNGLKIPFDADGNSSNPVMSQLLGGRTLGWHFTTDDTYQSFSPTATNYVRVNGSAADIDADHHFVYESNQLPTDLYYASLFDSRYGVPGRHDWDHLDNGLYGQHTNVDLDGVVYHADVSVGRAPAHSLDDAHAFVDKVIAYEQGRGVDGISVDRDWNRRVVLAAGNWFGRWWASSTNTDPPEAKRYHHKASSGKTRIQFEGTPKSFWRLISLVTDTDLRVLPYDTNAKASGRGWYWAVSGTDESPSEATINILTQSFTLPVPTPWVVAYGNEDEMAPASFVLDEDKLDGSAAAQERRRKELPGELPALTEVWRLYEDEIDVPPVDIPAAPLAHLTEAGLKAAMDSGPHILSLSGHGNQGSICSLFNGDWTGLTTRHTFITYASGCQTAWYEGKDVMGQIAVNNPKGAVAYVGYSRDGWIGPCDTIEATFFHALSRTRHLGLLNDARLQTITADTSPYDRWMVFVQNLFGDPEMPVWTRAPRSFLVDISQVNPNMFRLRVSDEDGDVGPVGGASIHIRQGDRTFLVAADGKGGAELELVPDGAAPFELTVSAYSYVPAHLTLLPTGPGWVTGKVRSVEVGSTASAYDRSPPRITLDLPREHDEPLVPRTWVVPNEVPEQALILAAAGEACRAAVPISIYVDDVQGGSTARGFRIEPSDAQRVPTEGPAAMDRRADEPDSPNDG